MSDPEQSFDPEQVRKFLRKSGFSIPKLRLTVRGQLEKRKQMLALKVPRLEYVFVLAGEEEFETL